MPGSLQILCSYESQSRFETASDQTVLFSDGFSRDDCPSDVAPNLAWLIVENVKIHRNLAFDAAI